MRALNLLYMNVVNQIRYELSIDPQSTYIKTLPFWKVLVLKTFSTKKARIEESGRKTTSVVYSGSGASPKQGKNGLFSSGGRETNTDILGSGNVNGPGSGVASMTSISKNTENSGKTDQIMILEMTGEIPLISLFYWIFSMLCICILGVFLEAYITAPSIGENVYSSLACLTPTMYARYSLQTIILIVTPIILYSIRDVEDSMNLRNEIFATSLVNMTIYLYYLLISFVPDLKVLKGEIGGGLLGVLGVTVQFCVTVVWPIVESYKIEKEMKVLTAAQLEGGQATIECMIAVLDNPVSFLEFKRELLLQFCIENGIFYDEYRKSERKFKSKNKKEATLVNVERELKRFDNMFIASGSQQELNIPYKIKKTFQELVKSGSADFEILTPIKDEVLRMMVL